LGLRHYFTDTEKIEGSIEGEQVLPLHTLRPIDFIHGRLRVPDKIHVKLPLLFNSRYKEPDTSKDMHNQQHEEDY
jgi:hypothetical protein